jgi:hypothetical protein
MSLKFGKTAPKYNPRTLLLGKYTAGVALPAPEAKRGWEYAVPDAVWATSMLGNDQVGDCVIAAILHYIMAARASSGQPVPAFTTQNALDLYSAITGYDPSQTQPDGSNPTDNGTAWTDALAYWQTTGVPIPGGAPDKILGWASFDYTDPVKLNQAIDIFGASLNGHQVTQSMEDQFNAGQPWNAPFSGAVLGGHGTPFLGYGRLGRTLITWAKREPTDPTFPTIMDEAYVVISPSWYAQAQKTPLGFDVAALTSDLVAIKA